MTFKEYLALKSLTTEEFAESICIFIDNKFIHEDKDSFLQRILWEDKYEEYLSLLD